SSTISNLSWKSRSGSPRFPISVGNHDQVIHDFQSHLETTTRSSTISNPTWKPRPDHPRFPIPLGNHDQIIHDFQSQLEIRIRFSTILGHRYVNLAARGKPPHSPARASDAWQRLRLHRKRPAVGFHAFLCEFATPADRLFGVAP